MNQIDLCDCKRVFQQNLFFRGRAKGGEFPATWTGECAQARDWSTVNMRAIAHPYPSKPTRRALRCPHEHIVRRYPRPRTQAFRSKRRGEPQRRGYLPLSRLNPHRPTRNPLARAWQGPPSVSLWGIGGMRSGAMLLACSSDRNGPCAKKIKNKKERGETEVSPLGKYLKLRTRWSEPSCPRTRSTCCSGRSGRTAGSSCWRCCRHRTSRG
jgi:hypothetical protein